MLIQRGAQFRIGFFREQRTPGDHEVQTTERRLMTPETLAHDALDAVARYRPARRLDRDRQPQTRVAAVIAPRQHQQRSVARFARVLENALELRRLGQPEFTRAARLQASRRVRRITAPGP